MPSIVNGLLLRNGQVLMVRRNPVRSNYPDCWSFPGGHVEPEESLDQALARELQEEIGIIPTRSKLLALLADRPEASQQSNQFHMFLVTDWIGEPELIGDEHTVMLWLNPLEAAALPDLALLQYRSLLKTLQNQGSCPA